MRTATPTARADARNGFMVTTPDVHPRPVREDHTKERGGCQGPSGRWSEAVSHISLRGSASVGTARCEILAQSGHRHGGEAQPYQDRAGAEGGPADHGIDRGADERKPAGGLPLARTERGPRP